MPLADNKRHEKRHCRRRRYFTSRCLILLRAADIDADNTPRLLYTAAYHGCYAYYADCHGRLLRYVCFC